MTSTERRIANQRAPNRERALFDGNSRPFLNEKRAPSSRIVVQPRQHDLIFAFSSLSSLSSPSPPLVAVFLFHFVVAFGFRELVPPQADLPFCLKFLTFSWPLSVGRVFQRVRSRVTITRAAVQRCRCRAGPRATRNLPTVSGYSCTFHGRA